MWTHIGVFVIMKYSKLCLFLQSSTENTDGSEDQPVSALK